MTLLLYAIAESGARAVDGRGVDDRPLRSIQEQSLVAVVSEHEQIATSASEDSLWEYERIVESLMDRWAILPARFGSRFEGEPELRTMVRDRHRQLAQAVDLVAGAVELSVTATWGDPAAAAPRSEHFSGTDYMLDRVEQHRRASALAGHLQPLAAAARASTQRLLVSASLPLVAAYLVERAAVQEFAARVRALDQQLQTADLVCTGPWPPYSFSGGSDS